LWRPQLAKANIPAGFPSYRNLEQTIGQRKCHVNSRCATVSCQSSRHIQDTSQFALRFFGLISVMPRESRPTSQELSILPNGILFDL
jgi:hypothetical protein